MATTHSTPAPGRVAARRQGVIDEAIVHAARIVAEEGAGALTVSEVARRMGMRPPSLYKYFPSLHALYDALFEHGNRVMAARVAAATEAMEPGLERMVTAARTVTRWGAEEIGYSPLMFWRPVPGYEPSAQAFAPAQEAMAVVAEDAAAAIAAGDLDPDADPSEVVRMLTAVAAGIVSQQLSNEPGVAFEDGAFTSLIDQWLAMVVAFYAPRRT